MDQDTRKHETMSPILAIIGALFQPSKRLKDVDQNMERADEAVCSTVEAKERLEQAAHALLEPVLHFRQRHH